MDENELLQRLSRLIDRWELLATQQTRESAKFIHICANDLRAELPN